MDNTRIYSPAEMVLAEMIADLLANSRSIKMYEFDGMYHMVTDEAQLEILFELLNKIVGEVNEDFYNTHLATEAELQAMNENLRNERIMKGDND